MSDYVRVVHTNAYRQCGLSKPQNFPPGSNEVAERAHKIRPAIVDDGCNERSGNLSIPQIQDHYVFLDLYRSEIKNVEMVFSRCKLIIVFDSWPLTAP
ncbi:hypothetical protein [Burkholderia ubonensis]|uniref:hypothetical protein n=1 Tax=Burkholderia ubonensis TaxID=101571 RepID=UPI0012F928C1|nr:hypothetical protein [Burkholderia ubonensis]